MPESQENSVRLVDLIQASNSHAPMQNYQLTKPEAPFLTARDAPTVEATNHESNHSYTAATSEALLFTGVNSCVLSPEVTEGPYCKFPVLS